ncbi:MAG: hypothetical protein ACK5OX_07985 [Desertimonas sp.]
MGSRSRELHVNPNARRRQVWFRDLDGYIVVVVVVVAAARPVRVSAALTWVTVRAPVR